MGVDVDMFVAPADGRRLSFEQFTHLLMSLVRERIVKLPFAIIEGDLTSKDEDGQADCFHPYGIILTPRRNPNAAQTKWQRCTGESLQELQAALHDLPFGKTDLAVWFDALDWDNDEVREALTRQGCANPEVVVYALQQPAEVVLGDAYVEDGNIHSYTLMHYFTTTGKSGPDSIEGTILETLLADYFGPAMIVDCSWG
jgi:hypothetical protein